MIHGPLVDGDMDHHYAYMQWYCRITRRFISQHGCSIIWYVLISVTIYIFFNKIFILLWLSDLIFFQSGGMMSIYELAQPDSIATSHMSSWTCHSVLHVFGEHTRVQSREFDYDDNRADDTPSLEHYASSSGVPPPPQHRRGLRWQTVSPYPMLEFTPYMSSSSYLYEDIG